MLTDTIYPNSPLIEAVFEVRFPGEPAVECRRDEFFHLVREKYNNVWVPNAEAGKPLALAPYHFKPDDGRCSIITAINRFAFSTKRYEGFKLFKAETMNLLPLFVEKYRIRRLNRTGLRYINAIKLPPVQSEVFPLAEYLNLELKLPKPFPTGFRVLDLGFVCNVEGGSITTRIGHMVAKDGLGEAILLDFDYAKEGDLHASHVESYLDESHNRTKEMFESILTPEYLRYVKGETI